MNKKYNDKHPSFSMNFVSLISNQVLLTIKSILELKQHQGMYYAGLLEDKILYICGITDNIDLFRPELSQGSGANLCIGGNIVKCFNTHIKNKIKLYKSKYTKKSKKSCVFKEDTQNAKLIKFETAQYFKGNHFLMMPVFPKLGRTDKVIGLICIYDKSISVKDDVNDNIGIDIDKMINIVNIYSGLFESINIKMDKDKSKYVHPNKIFEFPLMKILEEVTSNKKESIFNEILNKFEDKFPQLSGIDDLYDHVKDTTTELLNQSKIIYYKKNEDNKGLDVLIDKLIKLITYFDKSKDPLNQIQEYRDHVIHQFKVFLIGHIILHRINNGTSLFKEFKKPQFTKYLKKTGFVTDSKELNWDFIWLIAANFHDIGYPLQKCREIHLNLIKGLFSDKIWEKMDPKHQEGENILQNDFIKTNLWRLLTLEHYHGNIETMVNKKNKKLLMKEIGGRTFSDFFIQVFMFISWAELMDSNRTKLLESVTNLYSRDFMGRTFRCFISENNHALISAAAILSAFAQSASEAKNTNSSFYQTAFPIALAIICHSKTYLKNLFESLGNRPINWRLNPIAYLLCLIDNIQDYGRPENIESNKRKKNDAIQDRPGISEINTKINSVNGSPKKYEINIIIDTPLEYTEAKAEAKEWKDEIHETSNKLQNYWNTVSSDEVKITIKWTSENKELDPLYPLGKEKKIDYTSLVFTITDKV